MLRRHPYILIDTRSRPALAATLVVLFAATITAAADWPTYQANPAHSAVTGETLPDGLAQAWRFASRHRPVPAWDEPATWDGWNKVYNLKNRMIFDKAMHVAAAGNDVLFGSTVDDKVYCVDAVSGRTRWAFFTEGPIRLAPTIAGKRVFVASDDGYVYCLNRADGKLIWKQRPSPKARRIPSNGRLVSVWAVRAGLVVMDDTVYCCAGVFPAETIYLVALRARDGEVVWRNEINDLPAQGYMLASASKLYVTTGRDRPVAYDRQTGKRLYQVSGGGGGTFALLAGDSLMYGPGKTGEINLFESNAKDRVVNFAGNHIVVTPAMSYLHSDTDLAALDRTQYITLAKRRAKLSQQRGELAKRLKKMNKDSAEAETARKQILTMGASIDILAKQMRDCYKWRAKCEHPYALIMAGSTLYVGGDKSIAAIDTRTGQTAWTAPVDGIAYGLAAANGRLYVSTDAGSVYCFARGRATQN